MTKRPTEYERKEHPNVERPGYERLLFCETLAKDSTLQAKAYDWLDNHLN